MPQELVIKTAASPIGKTGLLVIFAGEGARLTKSAEQVWARTGLDMARLAAATKFAGKPGQLLDIPAPANLDADMLYVVGGPGTGDKKPDSPTAGTDRGGALMARILASKASEVALLLDGPDDSVQAVADLAAGLKLRHYRFDRYKTKKKDEENGPAAKLTITLHVADPSAVEAALEKRLATVEGTLLARDLINEPPNVLGPVEFADIAGDLAKLGLEIDTLTPEEMKERGMGALLAVAQGSVRPARLVVMQWNGGKKKDAPVAFVGKGVVFDTGGISIKPAGAMEDMKGDMGGAAAVTGLMKAVALRKAKANVVGVIGLVENMPDGNAYRPGDILTSMSGQTIEVINTDAEGRLVLADALWYTQDRFKPKFMVNLATLTGAILVSLGHDFAGLFSNDDDLARNLYAAGLASGEKVWRLPMGPAYDKLIESRFADMKNTGGRYGGSITAAQFLQRFVNDTPWAHLDIAGAAFGAPTTDTNSGWAPGFGVALLDRLIKDFCED